MSTTVLRLLPPLKSPNPLADLKMDTLFARQGKLLLKFGKKCTILPQTKELFPLNNKKHTMTTRNHQKYEILMHTLADL